MGSACLRAAVLVIIGALWRIDIDMARRADAAPPTDSAAAQGDETSPAVPGPKGTASPAGPIDTVPPRIVALNPAPGSWVVSNTGLGVIAIDFNEAVGVPLGAVTVWTANSGVLPLLGSVEMPAENRVVILLPQVIRDDRVTVVVDFTVTDLAGNALDGEVAQPSAAALPSGDGTHGGQAVFRINVLQGDVDRSGMVDQADGDIVAASLGDRDDEPGFEPRADLNGDGFVNVLDVAIWRNGLGHSLPATDGMSPTVASITPDPAAGFFNDLTEVVVTYSEPVDPSLFFNERTLFLVDASTGDLAVPASAALSPDGLSATYSLAPAVPQCADYSLRISNALADDSSELLAPPAPSPTLSGLRPPPVPMLDAHETLIASTSLTIAGSAPGATMIEASGPAGQASAPVAADGRFIIPVPLQENRANQVFFTGISACGVRGLSITTMVTVDTQPPSLFIDFPLAGAQIQAPTTDIAGRVADTHSGFMGLAVTVNGMAAEVNIGIGTNGTFFLPALALPTPGTPVVISAVATDSVGNSIARQVQVTRYEIPEGEPRMDAVSGNAQHASVNSLVADPIIVRMLRPDGSPFSGKIVTFEVTRSDGRLKGDPADPGAGSMLFQAFTDSLGEARAYWTLGSDAGMGNNRLNVTSRDIAGTVEFCASADPAPADQINIGSGNNQKGETNAPLGMPLVAWVSDGCNPAPGVPVTFSVLEGEGKVNGLDVVTVPTSPTGHASVNLTLGSDTGANVVAANFAGNPTGPATFIATGIVRDPLMPTSFRGLILDNASQPIGGVRCWIIINGVQVGETFSTEQGQFRFDDLPSGGDTDLWVDGLVATTLGGEPIPPGSFPGLHFEIATIPNAENSLPMPVLLPMLNPANARAYSTTQDTILTVEGMEGLKMTIKAGSMRLANGQAAPDGTIVALNQVHYDDVPMPIPDGAAPPFAWTLGPAGASFNPPIVIEYPNMSALPPGAIAYFFSFNHDTSRFEIVSSGHVVEDGSTIVSDAGGGLPIAGWGGNCPPYPITGDVCSEIPDEARDLGCCDDDPEVMAYIAELRAQQRAALFAAAARLDRAAELVRGAFGFGDDEPGLPFVELEKDLALFSASWATIRLSFVPMRGSFAAARWVCPLAVPPAPTAFWAAPACVFATGSLITSGATFLSGVGGVLFFGNRIYSQAQNALMLGDAYLELLAAARYEDDALAIEVEIQANCGVLAADQFIENRLQDLGDAIEAARTKLNDAQAKAAEIRLKVEAILADMEAITATVNEWYQFALSIINPIRDQPPRADDIECMIPLPDGTFYTATVPAGTDCNEVITSVPIDPADFYMNETELQDIESGFTDSLAAAELGQQANQGAIEAIGLAIDAANDVADALAPASWSVAAGGRIGTVGVARQFKIRNIPAVDNRGEEPDSGPDGLSDNYFRLTGALTIGDETQYFASGRFRLVADGSAPIGAPDYYGTTPPPFLPREIRFEPTVGFVEVGQQVQLMVTATPAIGQPYDATPQSEGTTYRTSNAAIGTVGPNGLFSAMTPGPVGITATNEGSTSVIRIYVTREVTSVQVCGLVQNLEGNPIAAAQVFTNYGGSAVTDIDGRFMMAVTSVPSEAEFIEVYATGMDGTQSLQGGSGPLGLPSSGMIDAGIILLRDLCPQQWADGFHLRGINGPVRALMVYDDDGLGPNPPSLVAGGDFDAAENAEANSIARWNPVTGAWSPLGGGIFGSVRALTAYDDDGTGPNPPLLVAGGFFNGVGNISAGGVARWNPITNSWSSFGEGNYFGVDGGVSALTVFDDDGAGPNPAMLIAGGSFYYAGDIEAHSVARWNPVTNSWSSLGFVEANGTAPEVLVLAVYDEDGVGPNAPYLVAVGSFRTEGTPSARNIARWDPATNSWSSFGVGASNGLSNRAYALVVYDPDGAGPSPAELIVGGEFQSAGGAAANRIARWNPVQQAWSAFITPGGVNGLSGSATVESLLVFDEDGPGPAPAAIVAGGEFTSAGGVTANRIARWDPTTSLWSSLGMGVTNGTSASVLALASYDDDGTGPNAGVMAAGGAFTTAGGATVNRIARWTQNSNSWSRFVTREANGLSQSVFGLTTYDGDGSGPSPETLVAGGQLRFAGTVTTNYVAVWDGATESWSALGTGAANGTNGPVYRFTHYDDDGIGPNPRLLVAGGDFTAAGGVTAKSVARWNPVTNSWSSLGTGAANGVTGVVFALTMYDDDGLDPNPASVVAGGTFTLAGGLAANRIARWNPLTNMWSSFGTGAGNGVGGPVEALAVLDDDGPGSNPPSLYAGGTFVTAGGTAANRIARWDPLTNAWSPLLTPNGGNGVGGGVYALAPFDEDGSGPFPTYLVVGGSFSAAGGNSARNIAFWDPITNLWSNLGAGATHGVSAPVNALTIFDDDGPGPSPKMIVAGGIFTSAGGMVSNYVARWSPLTNGWSSLGTGAANGMNGFVYSLAVYDPDSADQLALPRLMVGGSFDTAGGQISSFIAEWSRPTSCIPGIPSTLATAGGGSSLIFDPEHFVMEAPAPGTGATNNQGPAQPPGTTGSSAVMTTGAALVSASSSSLTPGQSASASESGPANAPPPGADPLVPHDGRILIRDAGPVEPTDAAAAELSKPKHATDIVPNQPAQGEAAATDTAAQLRSLLPPNSVWRLLSAEPDADQRGVYEAVAERRGEARRVRITILAPGEPCCDLDADGQVGMTDLVQVLQSFGADLPDADLNLDGAVDFNDVMTIVDGWTITSNATAGDSIQNEAPSTRRE